MSIKHITLHMAFDGGRWTDGGGVSWGFDRSRMNWAAVSRRSWRQTELPGATRSGKRVPGS